MSCKEDDEVRSQPAVLMRYVCHCSSSNRGPSISDVDAWHSRLNGYSFRYGVSRHRTIVAGLEWRHIFGLYSPHLAESKPATTIMSTMLCPRRVPLRGSTVAVMYSPRKSLRLTSTRLPAVNPPLSSSLPSDAFQLLPTPGKAGPAAEDSLFESQVETVKAWWNTSRYAGVKRPYSAEDVVSKRGSLQQTYASSLMARKLFNLLKQRAEVGVRTIAIGCHGSPLRHERVLQLNIYMGPELLTLEFIGSSPYIPVCRPSWAISGD